MYDIESCVSSIEAYNNNKLSYNKMEIKLNNMNKIFNTRDKALDKSNECATISTYDKIIIKYINNKIPFLQSNDEIIINTKDHILIDGLSGSGKTSILYFLRGIIIVDSYSIEPCLDIIKNKCFITLPSYKNLYTGRLYDIITNYSENPDIEMIKMALSLSNMDKYNDIKLLDEYIINIDTISAGEYTRLLIARTIYTVKLHNYEILLFDEIDTNLNEDMALLLCKTLLSIFSNNIILYISHNNNVKQIFTKKIFVKDGYIKQIFDSSK